PACQLPHHIRREADGDPSGRNGHGGGGAAPRRHPVRAARGGWRGVLPAVCGGGAVQRHDAGGCNGAAGNADRASDRRQ
ncbi:hypothetical protein RFY10_20095, partial [Acinetobacter baumannii]|nr:hypothetical protein [Acinetobacter baumannii]